MGLTCLAVGCQEGKGGETDRVQASGARERTLEQVQVETVVRRAMVQVLETTTVVESEAEIQLFPRATGAVLEVVAEEGDRVEQGQVLARLDARDMELAVRESEVALEEATQAVANAQLAVQEALAGVERLKLAADQAERDYERDRRLFEGGNTPSALSAKALEASRLTRDNAHAELKQAELAWQRRQLEEKSSKTAESRASVALERARLLLSYMEITSPIDGVIASRQIRVGDSASTAQAAFVVTDPVSLRAVIHRPQRELALFTATTIAAAAGEDDGRGQLQVSAVAEALPNAHFKGRILRTSPTVDADSGSFRVTARLETTSSEGARLLAGMLVRLEIVTDRHPDALVVSKRALRREGEETFVMLLDGKTVRRVAVREGFSEKQHVEIIALEAGTLDADDEVVTVGARDLEDGEEVQVDRPRREADSPAQSSDEAPSASDDTDPGDEAAENEPDEVAEQDESAAAAGQDA